MREEPCASELIAVVADFLRGEVLPALDGRLAFHVRVAANVLDICRREIEAGAVAETRERDRLAALLARDGDTAELNEALCAAIREAAMPSDDPRLLAHLWATTLDTLAIDQPNYETYKRAVSLRIANDGEDS